MCLQSLTLKEKVNPLKFKEKASEEGPSYKNLLLWMVRLIHANPLLMLNVCTRAFLPDFTGFLAGFIWINCV